MPIISLQSHRQVYLLSNQRHKKPFKIMMLPYLHERKIYLNSMKPDKQYFYTAIKERPGNIFGEDAKMNNTLMSGPLVNYMVSIDISSNKYFVYSEGGLLFNRVDYSREVNRYGVPIEVSNDGRNYIFQLPDKKDTINILRLDMKEFKFVKTIDIF